MINANNKRPSPSRSLTPPPNTKPGEAVPVGQYAQHLTLLEEVEWGPREDDPGYDSDQTLAPQPKYRVTADVCTCHEPKEGHRFTCRDDDCINFACREECRKLHCVEQCGNQRISRKEFKKVEVIDAGPKGYGLRVLEDCEKGDIIQEYIGRAVRVEALAKLFRRYQHERRLYIMALDDKTFLDARKAGGVARFINHSCDPNCKVEKWRVRGVFRAAVEALKPIKAGTELTFDYQWTRQVGRAPTKCYCGAPNCRGTLEVAKSIEEAQQENLETGTWVKPKDRHANERLVNRTIRFKAASHNVDEDEDTEWVTAEITEYDAHSKLHKVLHQNFEEKWQDLNDGMEYEILDEETSPSKGNAIARKAPINDPSMHLPSDVGASTAGRSLLTSFTAADKVVIKQPDFIFIQTPIKKDVFDGTEQNIKERCERTCEVSISLQQMARPPLPCNPNDPEDVAKYSALDQSVDGTVWKVSITGKDVGMAYKILSKHVQQAQKRQQQESQIIPPPLTGASLNAASLSGQMDSNRWVDEVIFPRVIAEYVKRKLSFLRERCRNVSIQITPSDSKSKQIARLMLEGTLLSDLHGARTQVRNAILGICTQELPPNDPLPMVTFGNLGSTEKVPRDFGFMGGSLTKVEFEALLRNGSKLLAGSVAPEHTSNRSSNSSRPKSFATSDLNKSPFFTSFESLYGPVWVQAEDDMGRIDSNHRLVGDASSTDDRKVYLGCDPGNLPKCWDIIHKRAQEVVRGVRFLFLGTDRIYLQFMNKVNFFVYIRDTTGAAVSIDSATGNHLRIDGQTSADKLLRLPERVRQLDEVKRADLAEDLVRLQIEVFRDQFTRMHNWIFGRDWTTLVIPADDPTPENPKQMTTSFGQLDIRTARQSCSEIADVVSNLGQPSSVAAHAATILYRYVAVVPETKLRGRDVILASIYIANKAQKIKKWQKIEAILEAGYRAFYPGTRFDPDKEEVILLEQRVVDAEEEILGKLEYDICVRGADNLEEAIPGAKESFLDAVYKFAFGSHVLAAGAKLWLTYGIEYIFAASAAFMGVDINSLVAHLGLIPLKVSQTLKLIIDLPSNDRAASQPGMDPKSKLERYQKIEIDCLELTKKNLVQPKTLGTQRQRYDDIGRANRRCYVIRGVSPQQVADHILGQLDGIEAESGCSVYFQRSSRSSGAEDIFIQGPWRAVAIADHLLRSIPALSNLPLPEDSVIGKDNEGALQVKTKTGLVDARDISTSKGWEGTLHPVGKQDQAERQLGGKSCVAGQISLEALRRSGLRWWIPRAKGSSPSGSFTEMFSIRCGDGDKLEQLAKMACMMEDAEGFPTLSTFLHDANEEMKDTKSPNEGLGVAVSVQKWPSEKIALKEQKRLKRSRRKILGFSPGALQELQLLTVLHSLVPSPHGHPNFILPVAVAVPSQKESEKVDEAKMEGDDPMFSLFKTSRENERAATKERDVRSSPHIVFQACPFILQRFLNRKKKDAGDILGAPCVVSSWFHDMVSAVLHCHSNNVIIRTINPDQVIVDHSGVAKVSGLYRSIVVGMKERRRPTDMKAVAKELRKAKKKNQDDEDDAASPFTAPEILLGSTKQTKEADIWNLGCLLANILLSKSCFSGKDKQSLLTSIYKLVGIPGKGNFEIGIRFPNYTKPAKKYRPGVEKALSVMLKGDHPEKYAGAIDLISKMLRLDPSERCTAEEAMDHEFLRQHRVDTEQRLFREQYVKEWIGLKGQLVQSSKHSKGGSMLLEQRKALIFATTTGGEKTDDLYDFEL